MGAVQLVVGSPLLTFEVLFSILFQFQTFSSIFNALICSFVAIFLLILGKVGFLSEFFQKISFHRSAFGRFSKKRRLVKVFF